MSKQIYWIDSQDAIYLFIECDKTSMMNAIRPTIYAVNDTRFIDYRPFFASANKLRLKLHGDEDGYSFFSTYINKQKNYLSELNFESDQH